MPVPDRIAFLLDVVAAEQTYLAQTDERLFQQPMTPERAASLPNDAVLGERVDAFVARFGRLQDTVGDKLLPAVLTWLGEPLGPVIDNLARAERLGWLASADEWMTLRQLRNRMVHEYIKDPALLADALQAGHQAVPELTKVAQSLRAEVEQRRAAP